jgi:hypothetical protein
MKALRCVLLLELAGMCVFAQGQDACPKTVIARAIIRIWVSRQGYKPGVLLISSDKLECKLADAAFKGWIIDRGRQVVFTTAGGDGGYENEGQQLHLYDAGTGRERQILSSPFVIDSVRELETHVGHLALLVEMRDGGLGASHVAIVDPRRGEVFAVQKARVLSSEGSVLKLGFFHDGDWETLALGKPVRPYRVRSYKIEQLLRRQTQRKQVLHQ